jgi:hypothetical protein
MSFAGRSQAFIGAAAETGHCRRIAAASTSTIAGFNIKPVTAQSE